MNQQFQGANYYAPMDAISESISQKPRIVQCIQCFNEQDFIWYTLKSIYEEVDHIRVIEGAVGNQVNATEDGHSTDNTIQIIEDFIKNKDPDHKVKLIQRDGPFKSLEDMKNTFLDYAVKGEFLLINDCDEIYDYHQIRKLRIVIDLNPTASEFVPMFLHFYRDFQHIAKPGPEWQPQHQRLIRFIPGMRYNSHPVVTDPQGHCTYFSPHYQPRRFVVPDWFVWHYGYARLNMDQIMKNKQEYYKKELAGHGGADKPFDEKVDIFLNRKEKLEDICEYPLEKHPNIMTGHPMFTYNDPIWCEKKMQGWHEVEPYSLDKVGNIHLWMTGLNPRMKFYSNQISLREIEE